MQDALKDNPKDTRLADFKAQENLNIKLAAICDVFDVRAEDFLASFHNDDNKVKRFKTHTEMINSGEVDAVVMAPPDHWHAPMSIEALNAGVHV
jgi:predicted dehydrogenase